MKIYAPVKDANGIYASVRFVNGVGETDNPRLIEWFRSHGYKLSGKFPSPDTHSVENTSAEINQSVENDETEVQDDDVEMMGYPDKKKSFEEMTPNELRQWMMENGFGSKIRNTRNKEKLLEILRG